MTKRGPFKVTGSKLQYKNRWMTLREYQVLRPSGDPGIFAVAEFSTGVLIVALNKNGEVYLTNEFRFAYNGVSIELPSGGVEEGQTPLMAAKRELREEAGLAAKTWTEIGRMEALSSVVVNPFVIYLAEDLEQVGQSLEDGEIIKLELKKLDEAYAMAMNGEIVYAPAVAALARVKHHLETREKSK